MGTVNQIFFSFLLLFNLFHQQLHAQTDANQSSKRLRIGVPLKSGFRELVNLEYDPKFNSTKVTGFCIDVFEAALELLQHNFSYDYIPFVDANGHKAGTYNDLVYQVYLQNYDCVVGDTTITVNRSNYVDFTWPYTDTGVGIIERTDNGSNMWVFLEPLDKKLWLTAACFFILTGFVVWVIEHPMNEEFQGSVTEQIGTIFWFSFSTLVFAHREKLKSNLSKFIVIVWVFVVLILTSSYTATLSSLLTIQQIRIASKGMFIGSQNDSFVRKIVFDNWNFENVTKSYSSPEEYAEALTKGSKNGGVDAIFAEIPYVKIFLAKYSADYRMVASQSTTSGFGFVFQKGSPLVQQISMAIIRLREERKLEMMENKWLKLKYQSPLSSSSSDTQNSGICNNCNNKLKFDNFRGLFLITSLTLASALLYVLLFRMPLRKLLNFKHLTVSMIRTNNRFTTMTTYFSLRRKEANVNQQTILK